MTDSKKTPAKRNVKRKTSVAKATPAKRKTTAKASTAKRSDTTKRYAHWELGFSPYYVHGHRTKIGGLITVAALVTAGFATFTKTKGIGAASKSGNAKLLRALIGSTPYSYHKRSGRIASDDTLTANGREWFAARISNDSDYDVVRDATTGFEKGGKFETIPGVEFKREVQA